MRFRKRATAIVAALTLAAGAAACSGPVSAGGSGGDSGGKTKIVYWSMFSTGEPLQQLMQSATDRFMKENPDITVEINWAGRDVLTKLQGAINAGQQVDIVDHSNDRVRSAVVLNHQALKLDDHLQQPAYGATTGKWLDDFSPGSIEAFAEKDGVYEIPRDVYVSGFWYNAEMLAAGRIEAAGHRNDVGPVPPAAAHAEEEESRRLAARRRREHRLLQQLVVHLPGHPAGGAGCVQAGGVRQDRAPWKQPVFLQAAQMVRELQDAG